MAVFLINICKFNGCGIKFNSLGELITHIENIHIDYNPQVIEEKEQSQPSCLPLSYVLRFITDAERDDDNLFGHSNGSDIKRKIVIKHHSYSLSSSNRSSTPTGSEMDEEEMMISESENSNESWTTEEISSEFIMRYGSRNSNGVNSNATNEKPFACPVPGCKKRYKNVNGIKYHSKNGHKKEGKRVRKGFKCYCGKSYKTSHGLKNHTAQSHSSGTAATAAAETFNGNASSLSTLLTAATSPSTSSSTSLSSLSQYRSPSPASISGGVNSINNNQSQLSPNAGVGRSSAAAAATSPLIVSEAAANVAVSALVTNQTASAAAVQAKSTASTVNANFFAIKTATKNLLNYASNASISLAVSSVTNGNKLIKSELVNVNTNSNLNNGVIDDDRNGVSGLGHFGILTNDSSLSLSPNTPIISKSSNFNVNDNNNNDFDHFECSNTSNGTTNGNSSSSSNINLNKNSVTIGEDT